MIGDMIVQVIYIIIMQIQVAYGDTYTTGDVDLDYI